MLGKLLRPIGLHEQATVPSWRQKLGDTSSICIAPCIRCWLLLSCRTCPSLSPFGTTGVTCFMCTSHWHSILSPFLLAYLTTHPSNQRMSVWVCGRCPQRKETRTPWLEWYLGIFLKNRLPTSTGPHAISSCDRLEETHEASSLTIASAPAVLSTAGAKAHSILPHSFTYFPL